MRSHLLDGVVRHRRARPFVVRAASTPCSTPRWTSTSWTWWIARSRLFRRNRPGPGRLPGRRSPGPAGERRRDRRSSITSAPRARTRAAGGSRSSPNLRVAGYVFDPASFFLCRDADGVLRVVVVEVHNTHGERHLYTLRPRDGGRDTFVASMDKAFYVSPFIEMRGGYEVRVRDEPSRLRITINQHQPEGLELHASLDLAGGR